MSSILGKILKISTWGESHGLGLGVVIDGFPSGMSISEAEIQADLNRRRPGQSKLNTPRKEGDLVEIYSGVFEGKTTGTSISLIIKNQDQRSHDYGDMVKLYRPSHADLSYDLKYGFRDYRGGGRASARETAARVAAGAMARKLLKEACNCEILAWVDQVHTIKATIDSATPTLKDVESNPVRCPDIKAAKLMEEKVLEVKKQQDSVGGCVTLRVKNCPVGLGEPVFDKIDALLAQALMSIPATKGFEIGSGFACVEQLGSEHNDRICFKNGKFTSETNNAGGVLGGISNGEDIICRIAFKPTPTISKAQKTVNQAGDEVILKAKGRHDPCVTLRAPVIVEAMAAMVIADLFLQQKAKQVF